MHLASTILPKRNVRASPGSGRLNPVVCWGTARMGRTPISYRMCLLDELSKTVQTAYSMRVSTRSWPEPIWHERITADQWQGKLAESIASDLHPNTDPKELDSDPDVTDSESDSDSLALFPDTSETDFDGDFIGIEQDCDDWRVASAAALDLPPLPPAPDTIEEALAGPDSKLWHAAIMKELEMMEKLKVVDVAQ
ncbi:hypothetical protein B484DRAFT_354995, partial [Ochromonadaceae sp. CCMP2298]